MSWHDEMLAQATRIAFGESPLLHDEVRVESEFDDGYDPTYGQGDPRFNIDVTLYRNGAVVGHRGYSGSEIDGFLKALLADPETEVVQAREAALERNAYRLLDGHGRAR